MGLNLTNPELLYIGLREHVGHELEIVSYADGMNIAIECIECNCVLVDADDPEAE
jgi:hypothetical protein